MSSSLLHRLVGIRQRNVLAVCLHRGVVFRGSNDVLGLGERVHGGKFVVVSAVCVVHNCSCVLFFRRIRCEGGHRRDRLLLIPRLLDK